jgi:hypothetical protein
MKCQAELQVTGKTRNRKYKVISVPDLEQVHRDMMSVVKAMHDSTKHLRRCEGLTFSLLDLPDPYVS